MFFHTFVYVCVYKKHTLFETDFGPPGTPQGPLRGPQGPLQVPSGDAHLSPFEVLRPPQDPSGTPQGVPKTFQNLNT